MSNKTEIVVRRASYRKVVSAISGSPLNRSFVEALLDEPFQVVELNGSGPEAWGFPSRSRSRTNPNSIRTLSTRLERGCGFNVSIMCLLLHLHRRVEQGCFCMGRHCPATKPLTPIQRCASMCRCFLYLRVTVYSFPPLTRSAYSPVGQGCISSTNALFTSTER
jgi:hypothetical protein